MYAIHVCVCVSVYNYTKGESYATVSMTVTRKAGARKLAAHRSQQRTGRMPYSILYHVVWDAEAESRMRGLRAIFTLTLYIIRTDYYDLC